MSVSQLLTIIYIYESKLFFTQLFLRYFFAKFRLSTTLRFAGSENSGNLQKYVPYGVLTEQYLFFIEIKTQ